MEVLLFWMFNSSGRKRWHLHFEHFTGQMFFIKKDCDLFSNVSS